MGRVGGWVRIRGLGGPGWDETKGCVERPKEHKEHTTTGCDWWQFELMPIPVSIRIRIPIPMCKHVHMRTH